MSWGADSRLWSFAQVTTASICLIFHAVSPSIFGFTSITTEVTNCYMVQNDGGNMMIEKSGLTSLSIAGIGGRTEDLGKEKGSGMLSTAFLQAGGLGSTSPSTLGLTFHILLKEARYLLMWTIADSREERQKKGDDATVGRKLECLTSPLKNCHWSLKWGLCGSTVSRIIWCTVRGSLSQLWSFSSTTDWCKGVPVTAETILVSTIIQLKRNEKFWLRNADQALRKKKTKPKTQQPQKKIMR